ncbi:hypothetical protein GCM10011409_43240 [Lentibacillus populi]|uniref:Uncharacterized protein n=1 Tax=Lentibacillus populi TaxID=1827502 RepID=A0A9W5U1P6_9BACI|nr:hypothetical protein [Lentibacillus populi]GGB61341.1 hypothetical protein GCM10011409_43240 [Lentibacillus populi]
MANIKQETKDGCKITYKTSKEHTKKLMFDFFKRTSIPRIIAEHGKQKDEAI